MFFIEYSKLLFNKFSNKNYFEITPYRGDLPENLPEFDLEELVISYLQVKENYYVLSNSIANKSILPAYITQREDLFVCK
ncbi:MAG: hypothetical protein E6578_08750 [Streptococcus mitis]|nr:hypothetical protein [Streptococcus mitis]